MEVEVLPTAPHLSLAWGRYCNRHLRTTKIFLDIKLTISEGLLVFVPSPFGSPRPWSNKMAEFFADNGMGFKHVDGHQHIHV